MKALIIGSGLVGTTSAYFLARRGWEVTVLDRQDGPGQETSFANGSLLTHSMPEPWNAPGSWRVLLASIGRADSPLKLRLKALPHLGRWGIGFCATRARCTTSDHARRAGVEFGFRTPVVVPLEKAIRVAGTAEFAGYDLSPTESRIANLMTLLKQVLPAGGFERAQAKAWCGPRPMSVDGVPIIGSTPIGNLWLNTGHGRLGWTMAAGSGKLLTDLLTGGSARVAPEEYALARFSGAG